MSNELAGAVVVFVFGAAFGMVLLAQLQDWADRGRRR